MKMSKTIFSWTTVVVFISLSTKKALGLDVSLTDDPSLWPGHKEPLGSRQPQHNIEAVDSYPEAVDFFRDYVDKSKPLLIRGGVKSSPAFKLWYNDYLRSHPEAKTFEVFVETGHKKENRTYGGKNIILEEFINRYQIDEMYMVNGVPDHLQKDVQLPAPLRCEESRSLLDSTVTWFSSGGTKSVLHNDDVDNINCLIRGKKQLMFINYDKYKTKVKIDRPEGGYADVDVDAVDFNVYPGLREVEYINATMHEGDCLFIPYKWFHQVNSWANDQGMNVAVNVWFQHVRGHRPKKCKLSPEEATLEKYRFSDLERQKSEKEGEGQEKETMLQHFEQYLQDVKGGELEFDQFCDILSQDRITKADISKYSKSKSFRDVSQHLFDLLDVNKNGKLEISDFDEHEKIGYDEQEKKVSQSVARVEDYAEDVVEAISKGTSFEDFEAGLASGQQDSGTDPQQSEEEADVDTIEDAETEQPNSKDEL